MSGYRFWAQQDIDLVKSEYPKGNLGVLCVKLGRTLGSIQTCAHKNNVWRRPPSRTSKKTRTKRHAYYLKNKEKILADTCERYAKRREAQLANGLIIIRQKKFTDEEVRILKRDYVRKGARQVAEEIHHPASSVWSYASKLGIHRYGHLTPKQKIEHHKMTYDKLFSRWKRLRAPQTKHEKMGKEWLLNNGFDYVYWFGEHKGRRGFYRRKFPFDYYGEAFGQSWFIDATTSVGKSTKKLFNEVFSRFARVGVLFVGKRDCVFIELTAHHHHSAQLNNSHLAKLENESVVS